MEPTFGENTPQTSVEPKEEIITQADPLKIDLDDASFVSVMDNLIDKSRSHFRKKDLYKRREKNLEYWLGQQTANMEKAGKLSEYNARFEDNIIYESEKKLKAIAVSRVPDFIVIPGDTESEEQEQIAEELTEIINSQLRQRENRKVLGRAYWHRSIYFTGIIKCRWDDEKGDNGDYCFETIHPNNIDVDETAMDNNVDNMDWIAHHYELSLKEIFMRWPDKEQELLNELGYQDGGKSEKRLATKIKISEIWFTWYKKNGDKWEKLEGVAWKYRNVVFDKIKNPYWDWEGESNLFTHDVETGKRRKAEPEEVREALINPFAQPLESGKVFYNYFRNPKKPFMFLGYEQLGMGPYDETTRIEQTQYLQDNINVRGRQITELAAGAKGKNVFSTDSGLTATDVEEIDMSNPHQDLLVNGKLSDVHTVIPGTLPTAALFQEQDINRERAFTKMGTNAALRGVREGPDPATKTQLFKESAFTDIDDEVEDTINQVCEQMARWALHMIKLFYTEKHMQIIMGQKGQYIKTVLDRDMVEDGMAVEVSASSVDKLRRRSEAFELAGIGMIDPVSFFKDIEVNDPEGRAKKLMLFNMSPQLYLQEFVEGRNVPEMVQALEQTTADQMGQQMLQSGMTPQMGAGNAL